MPMVASLQEGSPPSRLARYHSEKETESSGKSSSSSEEEESGEDDVILAEYTGTGEAIEEALANSPEVVKQALVVEENLVNWVDLGTDVDWAQRTVEQMEKEIKMAEQRYSESSSSSSVSTMAEAERDDADGRQIEKVTNGNLNRFSFDLSSPSLLD